MLHCYTSEAVAGVAVSFRGFAALFAEKLCFSVLSVKISRGSASVFERLVAGMLDFGKFPAELVCGCVD